jgi:hypothetical protein
MRRSEGMPSRSLAWMPAARVGPQNRHSTRSSAASSSAPRQATWSRPGLGPAWGAVGDLLEVGVGDAGPVALGRIQHAAKPALTAFQKCFKTVSPGGLVSAAAGEETQAGGGVDTGLEFKILGPLEVRRGRVPVRVGGPRQRALLAVLLCHAGQVVSRG